MKKLIISLKPASESLKQFKNALTLNRQGKSRDGHYEIAFDSPQEFSKFVRNIEILIFIIETKPNSIYQLAKNMGKDQSNINKIINFFERYGIVQLKEEMVNNRMVKKPIFDYRKIEFDLSAA